MQSQIILELSAEKAFTYQKALLAMLGKVEMSTCDPACIEHLKTVYELLSKLNTPGFSIQNLRSNDKNL